MLGIQFAQTLDIGEDIGELSDHLFLFALIDTQMREFFKFFQNGMIYMHNNSLALI